MNNGEEDGQGWMQLQHIQILNGQQKLQSLLRK
ncbi:hypothetical protein JOC55_005060 [Paenibacillus sacheonensis]|nr:hypothetical protein [Paenibacillus sacheonensis]